MNKRLFNTSLLAGVLASLGLGSGALAQAYPTKPLRVVVPQPPGGGFDVVGRLLADRLGKALGQGAVVENRPGSGTLVGTDLVAKAAPDGYTLLVGSVSNLALNPGLYRNLPYDSLRDFEPVGLAVAYSYTLMGRKDLPFNTLAELVAYARANPGKLTFASAGNGSGQTQLSLAPAVAGSMPLLKQLMVSTAVYGSGVSSSLVNSSSSVGGMLVAKAVSTTSSSAVAAIGGPSGRLDEGGTSMYLRAYGTGTVPK